MAPPILASLVTLLLFTTPVLSQATPSSVIVIPTPGTWDDARDGCNALGHTLYPVPASPTDQVYSVLVQQPGDKYWIARRRGGSCTCLNKEGTGDLLEEAPCGEELPAFCAGD
jgi:hypothetical protein